MTPGIISGCVYPISKFPSPCGEKVGVTPSDSDFDTAGATLPSPCGEKVGVTEKRMGVYDICSFVVSVPLRGKGRCDLMFFGAFSLSFICFRPLAGKR